VNITDGISWETAPVFVQARDDEVHVWRSALDVPSSKIESLGRILSEDERMRSARFHFQRDRSRFIAARASLRILIGRYLHKPPSEVKFSYTPNGKPFLAGEKEVPLRFNLSHSHGLALYAVTSGREVGIDLEYSDMSLDFEAIAKRFFSVQEIAAIDSFPEHERRQAFFACWTRKEAYIKARGEGLSVPLNSFSVSLIPGEPARLVDIEEDCESSRWFFLEVVPKAGYVGALAVESGHWQPRFWDFQVG